MNKWVSEFCKNIDNILEKCSIYDSPECSSALSLSFGKKVSKKKKKKKISVKRSKKKQIKGSNNARIY